MSCILVGKFENNILKLKLDGNASPEGSGFFNLIVIGNLQTVNIMARIKKSFLSSELSEMNNSIGVWCNIENEIYIRIDTGDDYVDVNSWVCLDVDTAIKFSKELRIAISQAKEVFNG